MHKINDFDKQYGEKYDKAVKQRAIDIQNQNTK